MKNFFLLFLAILVSAWATAQVPANYYNAATGTGYTLKTQLNNIVTTGHNALTYNQLWSTYPLTHIDTFEDVDNSVFDIYTEIPGGMAAPDVTTFTFVQDQCGNSTAEGDCYNREHLFPQGFFGNTGDARSDLHQVWPADGWINNARGNSQFGEVADNTGTPFSNGTRIGPNTFPGFTGTVIEPIDEYKGDVARAMLYFAVRYQNEWNGSNWDPHTDTNNPLNGTSDQFYEQWQIDLFLSWHASDPVTAVEIARNDEIYDQQGNANPFINNPQFVNMIWSATNDTTPPTDPTNLTVANTTVSQISLTWTASTDASGIDEYELEYGVGTFTPGSGTTTVVTFTGNLTTGTITGLIPDTNYCFALRAKDTFGNYSGWTAVTCGMTNAGSTGGTATDLFVSEYVEGSGTNKVIEIANYTGAAVDLSAYSLRRDLNGGGNFGAELALSGMLANQTTYVVANSGGTYSFTPDLATNADVMNFNGNDPVILRKNGVDLDVVGTTGGGDFAKDIGMIRIPAVNSPTTMFDMAGEWSTTAQNDFTDIGMHTISLATPEFNQIDVTVYPNPSSGVFSIQSREVITAIRVYDVQGRKIKTIENPQDTFSIDTSGFYLVVLESYHGKKGLKLIVQ